MELFPAIDLRDGKAVRLVQGDYNQMTVFSDRPEEVALGFKEQGAKNLHVVDLDGAKDAALANFDTIEKLIKTTGLFVEVGGGIRNEASIDKYLSLGAGRVILGTVAVTNYPFVEEMVRKYGDKIAVGVDAKDGFVATHGWLETSEVRGVDFCRRLRDTGVKTVIYTLLFIAGKSLQQALLKPGLVKEHHRDQDDGVQKHTKVVGAAQHLRQNRQEPRQYHQLNAIAVQQLQ